MPQQNVAVHQISFRGLSGTIFIFIALSLVVYVIGYATTGWSKDSRTNIQEGLWDTCRCGAGSPDKGWFHGTRAMITIGLIGLCGAFILSCLYMCIHSISKNLVIKLMIIVCFVSFAFMVVGFIIYGANRSGLHWSFAFTVIASIFTLIAGILSVVQMKKAGL